MKTIFSEQQPNHSTQILILPEHQVTNQNYRNNEIFDLKYKKFGFWTFSKTLGYHYLTKN